MKVHSIVDVITNSSSTVFINAPDMNRLKSIQNTFKIDNISIKLSKENFLNDGIDYYDIVYYLAEKNLPERHLWNDDDLYEEINRAYLAGEFDLSINAEYDESIDLYPYIDIFISGSENISILKLLNLIKTSVFNIYR